MSTDITPFGYRFIRDDDPRAEILRLRAEVERYQDAVGALGRLLAAIDTEPLRSKVELSFATFSAVRAADKALAALDVALPAAADPATEGVTE